MGLHQNGNLEQDRRRSDCERCVRVQNKRELTIRTGDLVVGKAKVHHEAHNLLDRLLLGGANQLNVSLKTSKLY